MRCAYHPNTETDLTCGRCDAPICPRCLIHTEVGIRCPKCSHAPKKSRLLLGALLAFGVVGLLVSVLALPRVLGLKPDVPSSDLPKTSALPTAAVMPTFPPLAPAPSYDVLITSTCTIGRHSTTCTGSVKNLLHHNLQHVEVVVALLSDDGTPQTSTAAPIDYDPLLPDQESPWTLYAPFNPALTKYSVSFRASGQPLRAQKQTP